MVIIGAVSLEFVGDEDFDFGPNRGEGDYWRSFASWLPATLFLFQCSSLFVKLDCGMAAIGSLPQALLLVSAFPHDFYYHPRKTSVFPRRDGLMYKAIRIHSA